MCMGACSVVWVCVCAYVCKETSTIFYWCMEYVIFTEARRGVNLEKSDCSTADDYLTLEKMKNRQREREREREIRFINILVYRGRRNWNIVNKSKCKYHHEIVCTSWLLPLLNTFIRTQFDTHKRTHTHSLTHTNWRTECLDNFTVVLSNSECI